jgi:hypothetical protein
LALSAPNIPMKRRKSNPVNAVLASRLPILSPP